MKKILIGIIIALTLLYLAIWLDIKQDKKNILIVKETSDVFSDWECGFKCNDSIFRVFEGEEYNVQRIRCGKDFIALKIKSKNGLFGWVILDERYKVIERN